MIDFIRGNQYFIDIYLQTKKGMKKINLPIGINRKILNKLSEK